MPEVVQSLMHWAGGEFWRLRKSGAARGNCKLQGWGFTKASLLPLPSQVPDAERQHL